MPALPQTNRLSIGRTNNTNVPMGVGAVGVANSAFYPSDINQVISGRGIRTFECYFNLSNISGNQFVFESQNTQNTAFGRVIYVPVFNAFLCQIRDLSGTIRSMSVPLVPTIGEWYHCVIRLNAGVWTSYVGRVGRNINNQTTTADTFPYSNNASITGINTFGARLFASVPSDTVQIGYGTSRLGSIFMAGNVSELRCWDNERTNVQIEDNKNVFVEYVPATDTANLIHCWRFNEGAATTAEIIDAGYNCSDTLPSWNTIYGPTLMAHPSYPYPTNTPIEVEVSASTAISFEQETERDLQPPPIQTGAAMGSVASATLTTLRGASTSATVAATPRPQFTLNITEQVTAETDASISSVATALLVTSRSAATPFTVEQVRDYDLDQIFARSAATPIGMASEATTLQVLAKSASTEATQFHFPALTATKTAFQVAATNTALEATPTAGQTLGKSRTTTATFNQQVDFLLNQSEQVTAQTTTAVTGVADQPTQVLAKSATTNVVATGIAQRDRDAEGVLSFAQQATVQRILAEEAASNTATMGSVAAQTLSQDRTASSPTSMGSVAAATKTQEVTASTTADMGSATNTPVQVLSASAQTTADIEVVASAAQVFSEETAATFATTVTAMLLPAGGTELAFSEIVPTLGNGPDVWWRFTEADGEQLQDFSGNGNTAVTQNAVLEEQESLLPGEPDNFSMSFPRQPANPQPFVVEDGGNNAGVNTATDPYSVVGVFRLDDNGGATSTRYILNKSNSYRFLVTTDGRLRFISTRSTGGVVTVDTGAGEIQDGVTYMFVGTWSQTNGVRLYVNGVLADEDGGAAGISNRNVPSSSLLVGTFQPIGTSFLPPDGLIDEVAVWTDYELTATDAEDLWDGRVNSPGTPVSADLTATMEQEVAVTQVLAKSAATTIDVDEDAEGIPVRPTNDGSMTITQDIEVCVPAAVTMDEEDDIQLELYSEEAALATVDIWNKAITLLGGKRVAGTSENSRNADIMRDNWDEIRKAFLADHSWNGSETEAQLSRFTNGDGVTVVNPANTGKWSYAFSLPSDQLRILRINGHPAETVAERFKISVLNNDTGPKRVLLTNEAEVYVEYVFDVGDNVHLLAPKTRQALAAVLAAEVATYFGKDESTKNSLRANADQEVRDARGVDGQEGFPQIFNQSSLVRSRIRR